jgi:hypothetical protein
MGYHDHPREFDVVAIKSPPSMPAWWMKDRTKHQRRMERWKKKSTFLQNEGVRYFAESRPWIEKDEELDNQWEASIMSERSQNMIG